MTSRAPEFDKNDTSLALQASTLRYHDQNVAGADDPRFALMVAGSERLRLAFATFTEPSGLVRSVAALADLGIAPGQFGIAGRDSTLRSIATSSAPLQTREAAAARLLSSLARRQDLLARASLIASPAAFWTPLDVFGVRPVDPLFTAPWLTGGMQEELEQRLANGAVLLGIRAETPQEYRASVRAVLDHSSHRVMTFDFSR